MSYIAWLFTTYFGFPGISWLIQLGYLPSAFVFLPSDGLYGLVFCHLIWFSCRQMVFIAWLFITCFRFPRIRWSLLAWLFTTCLFFPAIRWSLRLGYLPSALVFLTSVGLYGLVICHLIRFSSHQMVFIACFLPPACSLNKLDGF
ncbi:hypothetical protein [Bacillus sp. AK031]